MCWCLCNGTITYLLKFYIEGASENMKGDKKQDTNVGPST